MTDCIFTTRSPLGYDVSCSRTTWENHIVKGHKIMAENVEATKLAIEDPLAVYQSDEWPRRDVYFGKSAIATYGENLLTKVIVDSPDEYNETGIVVSAWVQKDISGNINEGELKHVKSKP